MFTLTAAAGVVDAVSYLRLGHVFVANMTGNILFIGLTLYPHSGLSPAAQVVALGGFVVGAALGGRLGRAFGQRVRRWMCVACGAEAVVLALVAVLVAVGALGMSLGTTVVLAVCFGLQTETARRLGAHDLTTTVLTTTLTGLAADSVLGGGSDGRVVRRLGSVLIMVVGAVSGALLVQVSPAAAIGLSAVLVGAVAVLFARAPAPVTTA
jgi:uncharacterized membrane protein YoaK (UPF0700 family)